jgi:hypothetical protein
MAGHARSERRESGRVQKHEHAVDLWDELISEMGLSKTLRIVVPTIPRADVPIRVPRKTPRARNAGKRPARPESDVG